MPIVVWFSGVSAVFQHWGILQPVVAWVGGAVKLVVGTSTAECFVAVANIFFGPVYVFHNFNLKQTNLKHYQGTLLRSVNKRK